jgi:hypothetical protein
MPIRFSERLTLAIIVSLAVVTTGCWFHGPGEIRREIAETTGREYSQEIGLTLGRTSMAIARLGLKAVDDEDVPSLKGIRKVQVGIYHPVSGALAAQDGSPLGVDAFPTWEPVVRMRDGGENVLVLIQERRDRIRGMLVIVDDGAELVVVRMRGRLDNVLQDAMKLGFDQADRPDLYEPALDEAEIEL